MGSPLRLTVAGASKARGRAAWRAVREEFEATEAALSRWRPDSDLTRLNQAAGSGRWQPVSPRLRRMLFTSRRAWRVTEGRFDPRVLARLEALGEHAGIALPAPPDGGPGVAGEPHPSALVCESSPRDGLARIAEPIDSGGIGKGLGLRWALRAACARAGAGIGLLIEAGGDIATRGPSSVGPAWQIGIEDPAGGEQLAVVALRDGAIATSSVSVRHWQSPSGEPVHHLIDPRSGASGGEGLLAVTVAMPDPAWAEVWSKALFLAGPARIGPEARRRGLAAWWVADGGSLEMTPAARERTLWERPRPVRLAS